MTKKELIKAMDIFFDDEKVVICDKHGVCDDIEKAERTKDGTAAIVLFEDTLIY